MTLVTAARAVSPALRARADARSRSTALASRALRVARRPVVVHDLGDGSAEHWFSERYAARLRRVSGASADATLVVASGLLETLTLDELRAAVGACADARTPALFSLNATGRVELSPMGAADRVLQSAADEHRRGALGDRAPLGSEAVDAAAGLFAAAGWHVRTADTPWRLGPGDERLIHEWLAGWVGADVARRPALQEWAGEVLRSRSIQLARGELRVVVHHRDLLAWPR